MSATFTIEDGDTPFCDVDFSLFHVQSSFRAKKLSFGWRNSMFVRESQGISKSYDCGNHDICKKILIFYITLNA